ncbi:MAG: hypothetical protein COB78_10075 [Hyphomicrobiales bacterium]|nr:MAG: hypothetical protein COB78_10075 [Hyphomicrobiales bacterium]
MPWWLKEIFASFRFLTISGSQGFWYSKRIYELVLPLFFAVGIVLVSEFYPNAFSPKLLKDISQNTFQFLVFVVPFHLAALGAFATFERPILDEKLKGTNSQIRVWSNEDQDYYYKALTLRQYVSLLFGYLCSIGIIYTIFYILFSAINFSYIFSNHYEWFLLISKFAIFFAISHYGFLSIYAITFLFDKVNGIPR